MPTSWRAALVVHDPGPDIQTAPFEDVDQLGIQQALVKADAPQGLVLRDMAEGGELPLNAME